MKPLRSLIFFAILFGGMVWAQSNPVPLVTQPLIPASVKPGHGGFTLTVNGTGFASNAVVNWNGTKRATTVVSNHELKATIDAKDVAKAGSASITVVNPSPGGGRSNVVFFPVEKLYSSVAMFSVPNSPTTTANAVGDFNADGKLDIAVGVTNKDGSGEIDIYLGRGDGTFAKPVKNLTVVANAVMLAADFNGDGKLDLAVLDGRGNTTIFLGNGHGKMVQQQVFSSPDGSLTASDFNGDGKLDLVVSGSYIYLGNGDGTFATGQAISSGGGTPAVGDFNGDGHLDLAMPSRCGTGGGLVV